MAKKQQQVEEIEEVEDGHTLRMGFFEHLGELRDRLLRAVLALVIGTIIGFVFARQGLEILRQPFCRLVDTDTVAEVVDTEEGTVTGVILDKDGCQFQLLDPTSGIIVYFRVALLIGGILAIPVMTYQVMMFILPGLTRKERRNVLLAIPAITVLFLVGVAFAWFILLPPALTFLNDFLPDLFRPEWTADGYLSFVTALIFWMGVAFETPLVFFTLSLMGFLTAGALIKNWRIAIVGSSIAAAFITPTIDPVNMFLVMGPLLGLYAFSILLVFIGSRMSAANST